MKSCQLQQLEQAGGYSISAIKTAFLTRGCWKPDWRQPHACATTRRCRRSAAAGARQRAAPEQRRTQLFERLRQKIAATGDETILALLEELKAYPVPQGSETLSIAGKHPGVVVPLQLKTKAGTLNFISTTTIFGSPVDVTLQELAMETFFPADSFTRETLQAIAAGLA